FGDAVRSRLAQSPVNPVPVTVEPVATEFSGYNDPSFPGQNPMASQYAAPNHYVAAPAGYPTYGNVAPPSERKGFALLSVIFLAVGLVLFVMHATISAISDLTYENFAVAFMAFGVLPVVLVFLGVLISRSLVVAKVLGAVLSGWV